MATMATGYSVASFDSIQELDVRQWDMLAPNDAMASHGWLSAVEGEPLEGVEVRYLVVRHGQAIVAAAPCYFCHHRHRLFDPDRLLFGRARRWATRLGISFLPAILVGPYLSYGPGLLVSESLPDATRDGVCRTLLTEIEKQARLHGMPIHFPGLHFGAKEISSLLVDRGYLWTRDHAVSYLDIEWRDFGEYLTSLDSFSRHMRNNVRKEMNRFQRSGVTIQVVENPNSHLSRIRQLLNEQYQRLSGTDFPFSTRFLSNLKGALGEECVIYGASCDGRLVGIALLLIVAHRRVAPIEPRRRIRAIR